MWRKDTEKMLIFRKKIDLFNPNDQRLGMKSYAIKLPRQLNFPVTNTEDKLYSSWQIYRYLQLKQEDGAHLALANEEVLIFEFDDIYFSAFDFVNMIFQE